MPIYEYQCTSCHHQFDLMQKMNDEPIKQCPQCLKNSVTKLISAAGFQLKGTGWYVTDFKNKNTSSTTKKSDNVKTETEKSTATSDSGTSETKSSLKDEAK